MVDIALVGAGRIGLPVARHLIHAGHSVRVHDIRAELEPRITALGATWGRPSPSPDILVTVLPGNLELRSAMLGDSGLLKHLRPGTGWLDLTSASPALAAELSTAANDRGIDYLETPVGGGPDAAEAGELTLYVGGEQATFDRVQPILRSFARQLHYTGPHGTGYLTKLLVNLLWFNQVVSVGETLLIAQRGGLEPDRLTDILLTGPAASAFLHDVVPRFLAGDHMTTFGLDRIVEELESLQEFAQLHQVPADMTSLVANVHRDALARFGPVDGELLAITHLQQRMGQRQTGYQVDNQPEVTMSFDRPNPDDKHKTVSDSELNDALENDELTKGGLDFDKVEHEEGQRSPGPEHNDVRRTPETEDVTTGEEGRPVEPPD